MISIRVSKAAVAKLQKRADGWGTRLYRDRVHYMFRELLKVSYQYSGEFTSNWHIVTGSDLPRFQSLPGKDSLGIRQQPHRAGDSEAIDVALSRNPRLGMTARPGDKVYFYNPTPLEFTATTVTGPGGTVPLRPENIVPGQVQLKTYMRRKFKGDL